MTPLYKLLLGKSSCPLFGYLRSGDVPLSLVLMPEKVVRTRLLCPWVFSSVSAGLTLFLCSYKIPYMVSAPHRRSLSGERSPSALPWAPLSLIAQKLYLLPCPKCSWEDAVQRSPLCLLVNSLQEEWQHFSALELAASISLLWPPWLFCPICLGHVGHVSRWLTVCMQIGSTLLLAQLEELGGHFHPRCHWRREEKDYRGHFTLQ